MTFYNSWQNFACTYFSSSFASCRTHTCTGAYDYVKHVIRPSTSSTSETWMFKVSLHSPDE